MTQCFSSSAIYRTNKYKSGLIDCISFNEFQQNPKRKTPNCRTLNMQANQFIWKFSAKKKMFWEKQSNKFYSQWKNMKIHLQNGINMFKWEVLVSIFIFLYAWNVWTACNLFLSWNRTWKTRFNSIELPKAKNNTHNHHQRLMNKNEAETPTKTTFP